MSSAGRSDDSKEARFGHLLNPIRDLAQNWNIDVARDLEQYLEELEHIEVSFDGGITSLNFAEAARLIQGSACVYSRKVEYLYSLIYNALDLLAAQSKKGKKNTAADAGGDADAAALEEEAAEEFLLLDDVVAEGRNIDLPERREDVVSALEMTLAYSGGPSATPSQRRQAAAVLAKTPLSLLAASRFDRRDDRAADFLLQSCAVSRGGALLLDAPGIGGAARAGSGGAAGGPWNGGAGAGVGGLGAGSGAPSTLLDLSIAPIDRSHASNRTLGASGRLQQLLAGGDGRMSLGGASDAGSGAGGDGSMLMLGLDDGQPGAAVSGKAASAAAGKRVSFAPTGGLPDGDDSAAAPGGDAGAPGAAGAGANPNNASMFSDDGDDGNGYLSSAAFGGGGGEYDGGDYGDMGAAYGPIDGQYGENGEGQGIARAAADDDDHVPVSGEGMGGAGGLAGGRLTRASTGALSAAALRALGLYGDGDAAGAAVVDKWAQLDPLADAGPATHRPYKKGRTFLKLRDARLVSHAGPVAAAAAAMQAAAACGNKGVKDARDLAARAAALSQKVALARTLGAKPGAAGRSAAASATASLALALAGASASAAASSTAAAGAAPATAAPPRRLVSAQLQALAAAVWPRLAAAGNSTGSSSSSSSSGGARATAASLSASMAVLSLAAPLAAELEPLFRRQKAAALQARLATRKAAARASAAAAAAGAAYAMTAASGVEEEEEGGYAVNRAGAGVDDQGRPLPYGGDGDGQGYYDGGGDWGAYAGDGGDDDDDDGPWGGSAAAGGGAPGAPSRGGEGDAAAAGLGAEDLSSGAASAAGGAEGPSSHAQRQAAAAEAAAAHRPRSLFSWLDDAAAAEELVRGTGLEPAAVWDRLGMGLHGSGSGGEEGGEGGEEGGLFGGASYADLVRQHMKTIEANLRDAAAFAHETGMAKRVSHWQDKLAPVLNAEDARPEFDIHVYGDAVLDRLADLLTTGASIGAAASGAGAGAATGELNSAAGGAGRALAPVAAAMAMRQDGGSDGDNDDEDDVDPETGRPMRLAAVGAGAAAPARTSSVAATGAGVAGAAAAALASPVDFAAVTGGAARWEVCRTFLATLQLANAGNVEIVPPTPASGAPGAAGRGGKAAPSVGGKPARGASGKARSGAAAGEEDGSWAFTQAVVYTDDDEALASSAAAKGAAAVAARVRGGALGGGACASEEAAFAARDANFGLRLLRAVRRKAVDAFAEDQAALHGVGAAPLPAAAGAARAGAAAPAGAAEGQAERRGRKRGGVAAAAAEGAAPRPSSSSAGGAVGSGGAVEELDSDGYAAGAAAGGASGAGLPASQRGRSGGPTLPQGAVVGRAGKRLAVEEAGTGAPVAKAAAFGGDAAVAAGAAAGGALRTLSGGLVQSGGFARSRSGSGKGEGEGGKGDSDRSASPPRRAGPSRGTKAAGAMPAAETAAVAAPSPMKPGELKSPLQKRMRRSSGRASADEGEESSRGAAASASGHSASTVTAEADSASRSVAGLTAALPSAIRFA